MPGAIDTLPLVDEGARLVLDVVPEPDDPSILTFTLTLSATDRPLSREVEHRSTNVLPFLFAFAADGKAVTTRKRDEGFMRMGGASGLVGLVGTNDAKTWRLRVTADSVERLLPRPLPDSLAIVAAFSERQHSPGAWGCPMPSTPPQAEHEAPIEGSVVLVRSNVVWIARVGERWLVVR